MLLRKSYNPVNFLFTNYFLSELKVSFMSVFHWACTSLCTQGKPGLGSEKGIYLVLWTSANWHYNS